MVVKSSKPAYTAFKEPIVLFLVRLQTFNSVINPGKYFIKDWGFHINSIGI